jgi:ankyrin repeat protein
VRTLIDAGVDLDAWDSQGNSLLHIAAVENHPEIITLLLDAGADIDRQRWGSGDTPVLEAVQHHNDEVTLLLLKRGADRTRRHQECSRSSAHYYGVLCRSQVCAQRAGRAESVTTHLELGADPQAKDADGIAAVDKAQAKGHDKIAELLSALVK